MDLTKNQKFQLEAMDATFRTVHRKTAEDSLGVNVATVVAKSDESRVLAEASDRDEGVAVANAIELARQKSNTPERAESKEDKLNAQVRALQAKVDSLTAAATE